MCMVLWANESRTAKSDIRVWKIVRKDKYGRLWAPYTGKRLTEYCERPLRSFENGWPYIVSTQGVFAYFSEESAKGELTAIRNFHPTLRFELISGYIPKGTIYWSTANTIAAPRMVWDIKGLHRKFMEWRDRKKKRLFDIYFYFDDNEGISKRAFG